MNIGDLSGKLKKIYDEVTNRESLDEYGKEAVKNIRDRTRQGYGVNSKGAKRTALKALSHSYVEDRKDLKKRGQLSSKTSPSGVRGKSNLTKSGSMLDSLKHNVKSGGFTVEVDGSDNQRKVRENAELGRVFLNFSDQDLKRLSSLIRERITKAIRKHI